MGSYAINLSFNKEFDGYVRELWRKSSEIKGTSFFRNVEGKAPHIAVGFYRGVESHGFISKFDKILNEELKSIELYVDAVAMFKATNLIFLQPNISIELIGIIDKVQEAFNEYEENINAYYKKERIFPHISIAHDNDIEIAKKIYECVLDNFEPQKVTVKGIELVEVIYKDNKIICSKTIEIKELD